MLYGELAKRFDDLAKLEANWDSYGAPPIPPEVLAKARSYAEEIVQRFPVEYRPQVTPCSHEAVQLEYHQNDKDLEIIIGKSEVSIYKSSTDEEYTATTIEDVIAAVKWLKTG